MRHVFLVSAIGLSSITAIADDRDFAIQKTAEAISQTETGKEMLKNLEKEATKLLPVEKDTAVVLGTTAISVVQGKVDTKPIKNMGFETMGGQIRPDLEYNFIKKDTEATVKYIKNF
jgi:hypothetical protein